MHTQIDNLYNPLHAFIKKRISNAQDAEDLTQDVFLKLAKSNESSLRSVKSWVYSIARNSIVDYYRKKKLDLVELEDQWFEINEELEDKAIQLSSCIIPFINKLPEEYKELMKLSELENLSQKEIAQQMDMNYTTLRSQIQRGRKKLKKLITDCCLVEQGRKGSIIHYQKKGNCA